MKPKTPENFNHKQQQIIPNTAENLSKTAKNLTEKQQYIYPETAKYLT